MKRGPALRHAVAMLAMLMLVAGCAWRLPYASPQPIEVFSAPAERVQPPDPARLGDTVPSARPAADAAVAVPRPVVAEASPAVPAAFSPSPAAATPVTTPALEDAKGLLPAEPPSARNARDRHTHAPDSSIDDAPANGNGLTLETGLYRCDLKRKVTVRRVSDDRQTMVVSWLGKDTTLQAVQAPSGALRYENRGAGLIWIVIVGKSMLLDSRIGRTLANECRI